MALRNASNVILLPAYRPSPEFAARVRLLTSPVILVDDGSGPEFRDLFDQLAALPHVTVLRHAVHRGESAARVSAIDHLLCAGASSGTVVIQDTEVDAHFLPWLIRFPALFHWVRLRATVSRAAPWVVLAMLVALVAVEIHGFRSASLFAQNLWEPVGQARLIQFAGVFSAVAIAILIVAPWTFTYLASGILLVLTAALLPKAVLAVAFFLLAANQLGEIVSPLHRKGPHSLILGIALYLIPMALLARLPINYPAVWFVLLAIPIAMRRPRLRLPRFSGLPTWGERLSFALLAFVFVIHWFAMLKPEAGPDGLALHLAVPADIARHHVLTFQPERFVWAVMPMGGDFLYAIVYQFGGEHGARLLNLALLAILLVLLHSAVRRWVGPATAWLLLALFAATPLVQLVTGELFIENLLAALLLGAFLAVSSGAWLAAALLGGAALGTKLGALPVIVLLAIYAAFARPRRRTALAAALLLLAAAAPPYAIAWLETGNPIFPFLNQKFHSRLLPRDAEIRDARFREPLTWRTPYDLTFRSNLYYEGQPGSFGFQFLILAPLGLIATLAVRRRTVAAATLIPLAAAIVILRSDPNVRYLYPELPLLYIPFAALLGWAMVRHRVLWRALLVCAIAAAVLNVWFIASGNYWHRDLYGPFTDVQREQYLKVTAPIRTAIAWFERTHPGAPVLLTGDTSIAGLTGPVYENQWHQFNTMDRIHRAPDAAALRAVLDQWKVNYVIARNTGIAQELRPQILRDLIAQCGTPEFAVADFYVARLEGGCTGPATSPNSAPELTAPAGRYDDFDSAILFRGNWERNIDFAQALAHTTSFTDEAGSEVAFAFAGSEVTWTFARAPNRGIAEVMLDGTSRGTVDLYATDAQWRQSVVFGDMKPGKHLLRIRVTGTHRPGAQGSYVDVDSLEVK